MADAGADCRRGRSRERDAHRRLPLARRALPAAGETAPPAAAPRDVRTQGADFDEVVWTLPIESTQGAPAHGAELRRRGALEAAALAHLEAAHGGVALDAHVAAEQGDAGGLHRGGDGHAAAGRDGHRLHQPRRRVPHRALRLDHRVRGPGGPRRRAHRRGALRERLVTQFADLPFVDGRASTWTT